MSNPRVHTQIHLPQEISDIVRSDGIARQVTSEEGGEYMMFLYHNGIVRSCTLDKWPEIQAELADRESRKQRSNITRQSALSEAQVAVGVPANQINALQLRALLNILLLKNGALDEDGKIKPIEEWL